VPSGNVVIEDDRALDALTRWSKSVHDGGREAPVCRAAGVGRVESSWGASSSVAVDKRS